MAKIIKGLAAEGPGQANGGRRVDARVYQAARQAEEILLCARAEAERIRGAAREERELLRAEAREDGRQEGLAQAAGMLARAATARDRTLAAMEQELIALAISVARKVLGRELKQDRSAVVDLAVQALGQARHRKEISIRVHPADAAELRRQERRLLEGLARARWIEVREDESLPAGAVLVETEAGMIDARLEPQLEALSQALEEAAR